MISIGGWAFNQDTGELARKGERIRLAEQQLQALLLLIEAGQNALVTREAFIAKLWPDGRVVEYDQSLNTCIRKLRKALADNAESPLFIETIPGKGYRLLVSPTALRARSHHPAKYRTIWGLSITVVVVMIVILLQLPSSRQAILPTTPQRMIVLPFEVNKHQDDTLAISANAVREALLTEMAGISAKELIVISGESVYTWQNNSEIHLASDLILSGMIQEDPLNIQMFFRINARNGQLLWSDSVNWLKGAGLKQQAPVVEQLLKGIQDVTKIFDLTSNKQVIRTDIVSFGHSPEQFNEAIFLAGQKQPEATDKAIQILQQLVTAEPDHVQAIVWLATLYQRVGGSDISRRQQAFGDALFWVSKGLQLMPESAELHRVLAYIQLYAQWQPEKALINIQKAVSAAPGNAQIRSLWAGVAMVLGDVEQALSQARLAQTLDPLAMMINADLCWYLNFARQFQQAVMECQKTINLQPNAAWIRLGLIEAQLQTQNWQGALNSLGHLLQQEFSVVGDPETEFKKAYLTWIQQLEKGYEVGRIDPYMIATLKAQIGLKEESIQWLKKAKAEKSGFFIFIGVDSRLDAIKNHSQFQSLLPDSR